VYSTNGTQFYGYGNMSNANTTIDKNTIFDLYGGGKGNIRPKFLIYLSISSAKFLVDYYICHSV
jgi:hypothetical protein